MPGSPPRRSSAPSTSSRDGPTSTSSSTRRSLADRSPRGPGRQSLIESPAMELNDKVCVVTGGASGIGAALSRRFAAEGARAVVIADRDADGATKVAGEIGAHALAVSTDVSVEADIEALVEKATDAFGPIDLFCSNAGIGVGGGVEAKNEDWQRIWGINLMAHVYAARHV